MEWLTEMPGKPWGVRRSRRSTASADPLRHQPHFMRDVDQGRFYLPDAEEEKRETLVTSTIDAQPLQCLRVPGPTFVTFFAAMFTGGIFIFSTFHWWWLAAISGVLALGAVVVWLWTGTAFIPEKEAKDVGLGLRLPLYASGPASVGWWAMRITMLGDITAFVALVFGYFFYWTIHADFPPDPTYGPGLARDQRRLIAGGVGSDAPGAAVGNKRDHAVGFYVGLLLAAALAVAGGVALLAGPWATGLTD